MPLCGAGQVPTGASHGHGDPQQGRARNQMVSREKSVGFEKGRLRIIWSFRAIYHSARLKLFMALKLRV